MTADREQTLAPCPFCGDSPLEDRIEPHDHSPVIMGFEALAYHYPGAWSIECVPCGFRIFSHESREEAVTKWNRRSTPSQDVAGEAQIRSMLDDLVHCVQYSDRNPTDGYAKDEVMIARRVIVDAFIALLSLRAQGWMPIASAPRDGQIILGWSLGWESATAIQWVEADISGPGDWDWNGTIQCPPSHDPTHWQPLPPPPSETGDPEKARP